MDFKNEYSIISAEMILESPNAPSLSVDVKANILELQFFENLFLPYVDAKMVITDDFGLRDLFGQQGLERFIITIGSPIDNEEIIVQKTFLFSKISDTQRLNERAEVLLCDLVEEHVFLNSIKKINRSFTSDFESMIEKICNVDLRPREMIRAAKQSAQGVRKVIVPYLNPINAIYWLLDRMTTKTGAPMYLHGTLYDDSLILTDLETLLTADTLNEKLPFRSSAAIGTTDAGITPYVEILSHRELEPENQIKMYEKGAIGSFHETLDVGTGTRSGKHISIRDIITEFGINEMIDTKVGQTVYDQSLEVDGQLSDDYNSVLIHQVSSSKTYNQFQNYHDEALVLNDQNDIAESKLKAKNRVIRQMLQRNRIEVDMSGAFFFATRASVGTKLRLLFLSPQSGSEGGIESIDKRRSGDYLLTAVKHKMIKTEHSVTLRLTKITELTSGAEVL